MALAGGLGMSQCDFSRGYAVAAASLFMFLSAGGALAARPACPLHEDRHDATGHWPTSDSGTNSTARPDTTRPKSSEPWFVDDPHGPADTLRFETDEATWVNVDVSPDGRTLLLDILGDLYTLPIGGGTATRLTRGPAYDFQPRWSPDGRQIALTSDRGGTDNLWVMNADGSQPRPVTSEKDKVMNCPRWSPDGQYLVGRKRLTDGSSIGTTELWLTHTKGGAGIQLTKKAELPEANEPLFSPDGRHIYFSARPSRYQYNRNVFGGIYQIRRFDRVTGQTTGLTDGYGGSARPEISPDGKTMAFVRRDRLKTVLYLYDLERLTERPLWDGLDQDMQENFAWTGSYPGFAFTPDGKSIVIWARGKLWSVDRSTGTPTNIPFRAAVEQIVTQALRFPRDIASDRFRVRMISWPTESPDGRTLVFAALGSLWQQPLPDGTARRLTTSGGLAYAPAFSPDGRWLAYTSWSDADGGHLWKMPAAGGASVRLTTLPSQYANPSFSRDGSRIVFIRGNNAAFRGHDVGDDAAHDILWVPAAGGAPERVLSVGSRGSSRRMPRVFWNAGGDRIFYTATETTGPFEEKTSLYSVKPDGTDSYEVVKFGYAEEIVPSPDGRWVAWNELHNAYVTLLPQIGRQTIAVSGAEGPVPAHQFTKDGGEWLNWAEGGKTVTWSYGPEFYRQNVDSLMALWDREALRRVKTRKSEQAKPDSILVDGKLVPKPKPEDTNHPDSLEVRLFVPRAKPSGTVALTGGRLITMKGREVIENGTVVITDNRITAIGPSSQVRPPAGARTIDISGKTVIPGLIDTHAHLHYNALDIIPEKQWADWCNLAYGVTTTHDPSASNYAVFTQAEMIEAGVMTGPRTFSTGYILYGAESPGMAVVKSLDDARDHLKRMKKLGAFSVKSYMQPRREQRQWINTAAREESMLVVPEGGGNLEMNCTFVLDGHTSNEHSLPVAPIYRDVAKLFGGSGTVETPTLLVAYGGLSGEHWFYQHYNVYENEKLLRFSPRGQIDARAIRRPVMTMDGDWHHMKVAAACRRILEEGGHVTLGAHGQLQGLGPHWELWGLTQGGISNFDALKCATISGAWALGIDGHVGSLEPGKLADLVVLDRNPLDKIENSDSIRYVVKNGVVYDGNTMATVWPAAGPPPRFGFDTWTGGAQTLPRP